MQGAPEVIRQLGRVARRLGQSLDRMGQSFQERQAYVEKLVASTRVVGIKGKEPNHGLQHFIASTASIIGDVTIGEMTSTWYGATVRGDKASVTIGRNTAILDNAFVTSVKGYPVTIGSDVSIGAGAVVRGATIGDGTMIGMGAQIMPGAVIGNDCFIDAGAVVPSGTKISSGQLWTGSPAQLLRSLSSDEMAYLRTTAVTTGELSQQYYTQSELSVVETEHQEDLRILRLENSMPADAPLPKPDADVVLYYKLTAPKPNSGLYRDQELDLPKELHAREEAERAADRAEEEFYYGQARLRRVGDAVKLLASTRPDRPALRDKVVADLEARDPEGAAQLRSIVHQAGLANADANAKADLLRTLTITDFSNYATPDEAKVAAEAIAAGLAAHAKALPSNNSSSSNQLR